MSSFTTPLIVSPQPNGRDWKLFRSFTYHIGTKYSQEYIRVPAGFITDFATIPKLFLWWLPYWAKYNKAAPLHDQLYEIGEIMGRSITRKEADDIFYEAMFVDFRHHKFGKVVAFLEYIVVRLFAFWAWKHHNKRKENGDKH